MHDNQAVPTSSSCASASDRTNREHVFKILFEQRAPANRTCHGRGPAQITKANAESETWKACGFECPMTSIIVLPGEVRFWMEVVQGEVLDPAEPWIAPSSLKGDGQNVRKAEEVGIHRYEHRRGSATQKIWVKGADGQESAHDVEAIAADLRIGHSVGLIYGAVAGTSQGVLIGALNLTTGGFSCSDSSDLERLTRTGLISAYVSREKSLLWGTAAARFVGALCYPVGGALHALAAGVATLPVALGGVLCARRRWARRAVSHVNQRALHVLLSKCDFQ